MKAASTAPDDRATRWDELVEAARTLDCIHCGLCLDTCPTYQLTGRESASPRGRIHLMRAANEGRVEPDAGFAAEMNGCLVCRRCESVCPAGVEFGPMMGQTRAALERTTPPTGVRRFWRWLGFRVLLRRRWALRTAVWLARFGQLTRLDRLGALLPGLPPAKDAPRVPPARERRRLTPPAPAGQPTTEALVLEGCVMPLLFGAENRATAATLAAHGVAVRVPDVACCGSLAAHNGDDAVAREQAKELIAGFETPDVPIVVNSAGCSSHMAELHELFDQGDPWHARARAFGARVVDFASFVAERFDPARAARPLADVRRVTWDDPCHLCHGMGVRVPPRDILDALVAAENDARATGPALERVELEDAEACCGSAGIYTLTHAQASRALLEDKLDALEASGADLLVTANPGCQLQWRTGIERRGLAVRVAHLASLTAP